MSSGPPQKRQRKAAPQAKRGSRGRSGARQKSAVCVDVDIAAVCGGVDVNLAGCAPDSADEGRGGLQAAVSELERVVGKAGLALQALRAIRAAREVQKPCRTQEATQEDAAKGCNLVSALLNHPSVDLAVAASGTLPSLQGLLGEDAEATSLAREVHVKLLMQLGSCAQSQRLAALDALKRLPHWDAETFVRSVKIPPFQKVSDLELSGKPSRDPEFERWHGALYFALDDEQAVVREATLEVLYASVLRQDLKYSRLLEGSFQRVAALSTLCLLDDDARVREAAGRTLVAAMELRKVSLSSPAKGSKVTPDTVHMANVLQALPVDTSVVFRVLQAARLTDVQSLEAAVSALLSWECASAREESELKRTLALLGKCHAGMLEPAGGRGFIEKAGRCHGLGHRLFCEMVEADEKRSGTSTKEMQDMGIGALHTSGPQLERLQALLRAAVGVCPALGVFVPGLEAPPAASPGGEKGLEDSLCLWARQLGRCLQSLRGAAQKAAASEHLRRGAFAARRELLGLQRACSSAARCAAEQNGGSLAGQRLTGQLAALAAWAALVLAAGRAVLGGQEDPAAASRGARLHVATSWLMHGFRWDKVEGAFPQVLLGFRLLSLRLLAGNEPDLADCLKEACQALGATPKESAEVSRKPLHLFLPNLHEDFFLGLLGPSSKVQAMRGRIHRVLDGTRRSVRAQQGVALPVQFEVALGGLLHAEVETNLERGAFLRVAFPAGEGEAPSEGGVEVPRSDGLRGCVVPLSFPSEVSSSNVVLRLQLVLRVDSCAAAELERGGTGLREGHPWHKGLNELPLGPQSEVPFTVTPSPQLDV